MPAALEKFQAATLRVRIELADLSSREMIDQAKAGRLDLVITPEPSATDVLPEFQWSELRRISIVLVMPETHPLAKLKKNRADAPPRSASDRIGARKFSRLCAICADDAQTFRRHTALHCLGQ